MAHHDHTAPASRMRLPGVYLGFARRVPAAPIASGVPLFVGFVDAPADIPPRAVNRWHQYASIYGAMSVGHMDYAVKGFFENAHSACWIAALAMPRDASADWMRARLVDCFKVGGPMEDLAEPDLVCIPDATWGPLGGEPAAVLEIQRAVLAYCNRMNDRMAIFDCLPARATSSLAKGAKSDPSSATARIAWLTEASDATPRAYRAAPASNGAVYWPWVSVPALARDPAGVRIVPPCGHVAGVFARVDHAAGRRKAPANEVLEGALDVDDEVDEQWLALLNDEGVNCLRAQPRDGVRVMGARTLSTLPAWRYINVRRTVLGLARWAELGLRDLVMDTNEPALWERIRQRVDSYCLARYREGALQGDEPAEAYFVKCDSETNPSASRELGRVVCEVGLAAAVPAEFIVMQLIQSAEGAALAG